MIRLPSGTSAIEEANDLAIQEYNRGNAGAAADIFAFIIAREPHNAFAHNNRGVALFALQRFDDALASYDKAIAIMSDYSEAHSNRAMTLLRMQRLNDALASCDNAIALNPDYADAHYNRGIILQTLRRFDDALTSYDNAIALNPGYAEAYAYRGNTLRALMRFDEALQSYDKAIAVTPGFPEFHYNRGVVLQILKRFDEALASYDRAIAIAPGYKDAYVSRGVALVSKGDMRQAEEMFLKALTLKPDSPDVLYELTKLRTYHHTDHAEVRSIHRLLNEPGISLRDRECLCFSLGKVYDECGLYDEAFDYYRQANEIINANTSYDAARISAVTSSIIEVFSKDFLSQPRPWASRSRTPLFIVGMPRSGTTLLASILSNHGAIGTAGELPTIIQFASRLGQIVESDVPYPQAAKAVTAAHAQQLTIAYEQRLRRDTRPDVQYVIDKHPLNCGHLGFIAMLFPQAQIIHCTRDPLDTCLSNYFQRFHAAYDFAFDLRNIGHFYGEYRRIMEHWRKALPGKMIEVTYEDMILDTAQVARTILGALGLEWDEHCLAPHTNPHAVETASKWQVRQPIYKRSMERWKHYEKHLAPLIESLQSAGMGG
jgi:tetratricopeptide (TPR) repeat protein